MFSGLISVMQLGPRELHGYGRVEVGDDTTKRVLNCRKERERGPLTEADRERRTETDRQTETEEGGRKSETEQAM